MKENQWLLRMLVKLTLAYLDKWMTAFHEYVSAAPRSIRNMRLSQTWHNLRGKWLLRGWEYSVLRDTELTGLSFQKPRKSPKYATGPNFYKRNTFKVCVHVYRCVDPVKLGLPKIRYFLPGGMGGRLGEESVLLLNSCLYIPWLVQNTCGFVWCHLVEIFIDS